MAASSSSAAESLCRDRILSSKLYFDVSPSKVSVIYSSSYDIAFLGIEKIGTKTKEYLDKLDEALEVARNDFDPELMVSDAAIDVLDGDPLVRLKVCPDGVSTRDDIVFRFARERNIPLVMLTSGGFMKSSAEATVDSIINLFNRNLIDLDRPLPLC